MWRKNKSSISVKFCPYSFGTSGPFTATVYKQCRAYLPPSKRLRELRDPAALLRLSFLVYTSPSRSCYLYLTWFLVLCVGLKYRRRRGKGSNGQSWVSIIGKCRFRSCCVGCWCSLVFCTRCLGYRFVFATKERPRILGMFRDRIGWVWTWMYIIWICLTIVQCLE